MDEAIFYINHGNDQRPTNAEVNPDKNESRTEPANYTPESNSEESLSNNDSKESSVDSMNSTKEASSISEIDNEESLHNLEEIQDRFE